MFKRGSRVAASILPAIAVIAPLALAHPVAALVPITITPQLFADPANNLCASDATCSLRGAVLKANGNAAVTKIQLLAGTYTLTLTRDPEVADTGVNGDLEITGSYKISGAGAGLTTVKGAPGTLNGGLNDRIFEIESLQGSPLTVSITDLKVTGGRAPNAASGEADGGGILNDSQSLTLTNVILDANSTRVGTSGSSADGGGSGGGLGTRNGNVIVSHSTFSNNVAAGDGGGIWNEDIGGHADSYRNLFITANTSQGGGQATQTGGGGIYNEVGALSTVAFSDVMITNNSAAFMNGGGVYENSGGSGPVTYDNMTLSGNSAVHLGGGFYDGSGAPTITNSTITGNRDSNPGPLESGGGVAVGIRAGTVTLNNDTVSSNTSPRNGAGLFVARRETIKLHNTLVIDNLGGGVVSNCASKNGTFTSTGHNMVNDTSCALGGAGDKEGAQYAPGLVALSANQGPRDGAPTADSATLTQALPLGSSAINAADNTNCPPIDEQHVTRPQQGTCDIGAFEFVLAAVPSPTPKLPAAGGAQPAADVSALLLGGLLVLAIAGIPVAIRASRR